MLTRDLQECTREYAGGLPGCRLWLVSFTLPGACHAMEPAHCSLLLHIEPELLRPLLARCLDMISLVPDSQGRLAHLHSQQCYL